MNSKIILLVLSIVAVTGFVAMSNLPISAMAAAPKKDSDHPGYNGLNQADKSIHKGAGFFSKGDVEFHTGTGQGGFCVSDVCPSR